MKALKYAMMCGLGLLLNVGAVAQDSNPGGIAITLHDQSGAVVAGGLISVSPVVHGLPNLVTTNSSGMAHLSKTSGVYELTAQVHGFKDITKTITLNGNPNQSVDFILEIDPSGLVECGPCPGKPAFTLDDLISAEPMTQLVQEELISPSRPIPTGKAPGMQVKLVSKHGGEKVYAVIFQKGDEVLSGLTDFAIQYHVGAAHFTGIGAVSSATVGWLNLPKKMYNAIHVDQQVEVLSMIGDVALYNGKPVVHAHMVFGKPDGSTVGGHLWEAHVNPTLEVFISVDAVPLQKKLDDESGMKVIDPKQ